MPISSTTFMPGVLTAGYLGSFAPHPQSGSIAGPFFAPSDTPSLSQRLILDDQSAQNLVENTQRAFGDCQQLRSYFAKANCPLPQPMPAPAQGWMLTSSQGQRQQNRIGSFAVEQGLGPMVLDVELKDENVAFFGVHLQSKNAEISQRISIDRRNHVVTTEQYQFRMAFKDRHVALAFAGDISTLVYESNQYALMSEVGGLRLREPDGREVPIEKIKGRYSARQVLPRPNGEILLCSALSVYVSASPEHREPVFYVKVTGNQDGPATALVTVNRPPRRPARRMPLQPRLIETLWEPLLKRIMNR